MNPLPLWKRCRILANPVRLAMLTCLEDQTRLYVQEVADLLRLKEDVASKNLQLLASGGFVESEAVSKYQFYSLSTEDALLNTALKDLKKGGNDSIDRAIKTLTALTHERRVSIVSILKRNKSMDRDDLFLLAQVSKMAGVRHMNKLLRRRWVAVEHKKYRLLEPESMLASVLLGLVK